MRHYYKAKEFVKNEQKRVECSCEIGKHVMNTAYYALKHNLEGDAFNAYLDSIVEKTHKKLYNCGCQCSIISPLGKRISAYDGGGDCIKYAEKTFKECVNCYYTALCVYNEDDGK